MGGKQEKSPSPFVDYRCLEFGLGVAPKDHKWEACRRLGLGFGYNSAEIPEDYMTSQVVAALYKDVTSKRGNLQINIGPLADGSIPDLQKTPLRALGRYLMA